MADFEPPSFSLGLDFEPPSFSLGLDFDLDSEPQSTVLPKPSVSLRTINEVDDDDDDFEFPKLVTDPQVSDPPSSLKRLRRGSISKSEPVAQKLKLGETWCNVDDDIEDFSSQEDEPKGK
ncbi:hypothetical protein KY290_032393 [Solanum tuberosum]|uniref:Uncharacterized protein n=1 Tax=Solanum tuberosum TaxID=4113 RepID=A0ABQ7UBZ3_SOLTU|nr:hypothetical protein KY290_032393 [Solanum tuberosum]